MTDMENKFLEKMKEDGVVEEFSEYIHLNFKMICTKIVSESRRRLNIEPALSSEYLSLMYSVHGRFFNEIVYATVAMLNTANMKLAALLPASTIELLQMMLNDEVPPKDMISEYLKNVERCYPKFKEFYPENIEELRKNEECEPKW